MMGMTIASLKKHPAIIPLYGCVLLGCGGALLYTIRLALRSPEVSWARHSNPEPWNEYANKRHQLYDPLGRTEPPKCPAPKY